MTTTATPIAGAVLAQLLRRLVAAGMRASKLASAARLASDVAKAANRRRMGAHRGAPLACRRARRAITTRRVPRMRRARQRHETHIRRRAGRVPARAICTIGDRRESPAEIDVIRRIGAKASCAVMRNARRREAAGPSYLRLSAARAVQIARAGPSAPQPHRAPVNP
ncbi:MAG TPA: hypothetical protein VHW23_44515 [Kofleriaceae bacterium]|nr:hypothetical protein [Kofleriaceae bacterium]